MKTDETLPPEPGEIPDPDLGIKDDSLPLEPPADEPDEPSEVNDDDEEEEDADGEV